ncbi:Tim10/DDP family zinc finger-domain-containing protein [Mycena amicta]|nr:Tim10/DDP family zinc finger-domain-containing protein [Mycena amicta]
MDPKLDEAAQRELSLFLERQQAEARVHASIHNFTGICWKKCVTGTPSTRFSRSEEACLTNCVERFLDTSLFMVRKIEEQRAAFQSNDS